MLHRSIAIRRGAHCEICDFQERFLARSDSWLSTADRDRLRNTTGALWNPPEEGTAARRSGVLTRSESARRPATAGTQRRVGEGEPAAPRSCG